MLRILNTLIDHLSIALSDFAAVGCGIGQAKRRTKIISRARCRVCSIQLTLGSVVTKSAQSDFDFDFPEMKLAGAKKKTRAQAADPRR